jgi:hypothetical protein
MISEVELNHAVEIQDSEAMLGETLATIGVISQEDLEQALVHQAEEIVYDLFLWPQAEFRFTDGERPPRTTADFAIDVTVATLHGMRRVDEWRRVRRVIPDLDAIPVWVAEPAHEDLDPSESLVLDMIDDCCSVRELCAATHSTEFNVCRVLLRQFSEGRLKIVSPRSGNASQPLPPTVVAPVPATALLAAADTLVDRGELIEALRHLRAASCLEPDNDSVRSGVAAAEARMLDQLRAEGLEPKAALVLDASPQSLSRGVLSPEEQFVVGRIEGRTTVEALTRVMPLPELEALLIFRSLLRSGHLELEGKKPRV